MILYFNVNIRDNIKKFQLMLKINFATYKTLKIKFIKKLIN